MSDKPPTTYMDLLGPIAQQDVNILHQKELDYGGSWKARGGVGAFMMAARKFDRIEQQLKRFDVSYNIFFAIQNDPRPEGIIDDIRDLRRYLLLIEAEATISGLIPHEDTTGQQRPLGFDPKDDVIG